jgi:hypothetical protein
MPRCIVISFRGAMALDPEGGARYLDEALRTKKRAEAHGATLCAWSAWTFSFVLDPDELEEAMTLASLAFGDAFYDGAPAPNPGPSPRAPSSPNLRPPAEAYFGVGMAEGEMSAVGERGSLAGLAWGLPLVTASALSRAASAGEVLIDADLLARCEAEIEALGFHTEGDRIKRLVRGPAAEGAAKTSDPPPFVPEPERPPVSLRQADPVTEMAKRALLQGDVNALERLIVELRESGEHSDLVERMSGFVALRRGATADALRRLRAATEAVKEPGQRARARLAYGVALASAGRTESALLEALEALARAREAGSPHGEHACALFLARLSASAGHPDAASAWAMIASRAEAAQPS